MLKNIIVISLLLGCLGCLNGTKKSKQNHTSLNFTQNDTILRYIDSLSINHLKTHLKFLASDSLMGRKSGERGHWIGLEYITNFYKQKKIKSLDSSYYQNIPDKYLPRKIDSTANVIAVIKGQEIQNEYVVVSAHSDHLGVQNNNIYNGADDNASGTSALLEIARVFKAAEKNGCKPKRNIVFCHFTAEEIGKGGSKFFVENKTVPIPKIIANLNIDMIGRIDTKHQDGNYVYIIGADRVSNGFENTIKKINKTYTNLQLDESYDTPNDPNRFFYRSDQYHFARQNIPVVFFFSGAHKDYHKSSDTEEKINYKALKKRAQLIFATTWQLAHQDKTFKTKQIIND